MQTNANDKKALDKDPQKSKTTTAEYMRIRRHVLNLIRGSGYKSIQLPSIKELAESFGVSRPTVSKAMKALTADGYVTGHPGIGSFTNPAKMQAFATILASKTIGILMGDGMMVTLDGYFSRLLGKLLCRLSALPVTVNLFNLTSHEPKAMLRDIQDEMLDLLIWNNPPSVEIVEQLRKTGLKVVASNLEANVPFSARIDFQGLGYVCGRQLLKEGRRNIVYMPATGTWASMLDGLRQAYDEAGVALNPNLFFPRLDTCLKDLRNAFALNAPIDTVVNVLFSNKAVMDILNEFGVDWRERCRILCPDMINGQDDFVGYSYAFPFERHADNLVELVEAALADAAPADADRPRLAQPAMEWVEREGGVCRKRTFVDAP